MARFRRGALLCALMLFFLPLVSCAESGAEATLWTASDVGLRRNKSAAAPLSLTGLTVSLLSSKDGLVLRVLSGESTALSLRAQKSGEETLLTLTGGEETLPYTLTLPFALPPKLLEGEADRETVTALCNGLLSALPFDMKGTDTLSFSDGQTLPVTLAVSELTAAHLSALNDEMTAWGLTPRPWTGAAVTLRLGGAGDHARIDGVLSCENAPDTWFALEMCALTPRGSFIQLSFSQNAVESSLSSLSTWQFDARQWLLRLTLPQLKTDVTLRQHTDRAGGEWLAEGQWRGDWARLTARLTRSAVPAPLFDQPDGARLPLRGMDEEAKAALSAELTALWQRAQEPLRRVEGLGLLLEKAAP